jgi:hypothetical protein
MTASKAKFLRHVIPGSAVLLMLAGCATTVFRDPIHSGPFYAPVNHVGDASLGGIRRVVLLPVWSGQVASIETAAQLDATMVAALQREQRFEVVTYSREAMRRRFHAESLSAAATLPHDLGSMLQRETGAEAVMFVDLTSYSPYRPLGIGLRAKLATINGDRLVWSFDDAFSALNPAVANSARRHFVGTNGRLPADLTPSVLQSPDRFAAYAASAMFATLPPVTPPAPNPRKGRSAAR